HPDKHLVVPPLLQPFAQARLDHAEVQHPTNQIKLAVIRLDGKVDAIIVTVEVGTLRLMAEDSVTTADVMIAVDAVHSHSWYWMTSGALLISNAVRRMKHGPHLPQCISPLR